MNKYQKLASNTFVLALGQFGSKFLVYVMLRFYTSWLGADGFGDVNNIINASALLISVVTLSINEGVLRYALDDTIRKKNHVLSIGINVALIGLVIFAAFVPLIGMIDMLSGYQWLIYMYVATGSIKGICAIYVRARGRVGLYAIDGTLTTIVVILLNILLLGVLHLGVVGYVLSISLGDMISIVFLTWRAGLLRQYRPLGNDRELAKGMIQYSVPLMPTAVMWWIINVSDTFMVTAIHGSAANGVYSFAYKFPNLAALVVGIFSQAWHMSAITERNSRKVSEFYSNVFSMMQTIMYITAAGILLVLRPIIMPFFGSKEFEMAYMYVPFLVLASTCSCFNQFMNSVYVVNKKSTRSMITMMAGAVSNCIMNYFFIKWWGPVGATYASFLGLGLVFTLRAMDAHGMIGMHVHPGRVLVNAAALVFEAFVLLADTPLYGLWTGIITALIILYNFSGVWAMARILLPKILGRRGKALVALVDGWAAKK